MANRKEPLLGSPARGGADYEWPNMSDECIDMMQASILMYAFADIRELARKGMLSGSDPDAIKRMMTLPVSAGDVMRVVAENMHVLKKALGGEGAESYFTSLDAVQESIRRQAVNAETGEAVLASASVVAFDDENSKSELVYGIAVNTGRRRITIAFRGSVTTSDFIADAKSVMNQIPTPVPGRSQSRKLGIHHGFYDYLFSTKRSKEKESKCDAVMHRLLALLDEYPGFRIYATGHSLGGALSTLFAFEAAASSDSRITKPVTCISIASPRVGNLAFRRAFQKLENNGQMRCLRIANYKDLVTLLPDRGSFSCLYILCCQQNVYRHVGMEITLYSDNNRYEISHSPESRSFLGVFFRDWKNQIKHSLSLLITLPFVCCCRENFLANHSCREYLERLQGVSAHLQVEYLNDLYRRKEKNHASSF